MDLYSRNHYVASFVAIHVDNILDVKELEPLACPEKRAPKKPVQAQKDLCTQQQLNNPFVVPSWWWKIKM